MEEIEIRDFFDCPKCGRPSLGFARCRTPGCGGLREGFRGRESVVVEETGRCVISGAWTDVRLPNGDYLWAPYFLAFLQWGWLDSGFCYTEAYYETHPRQRSS